MNATGSPDAPALTAARLREHLRQRPDDGPAWFDLAQALARQTPGPELYHAIEQTLRSLPENPDAWLLAARVHQRQNGAAAALRWLDHTSSQNPGLTAPRVAGAIVRGDTLRQSAQWRQALAAYREAEPSRPRDPVLLNDIGSCLASLEQYDEASRYFERALNAREGFAEARLNLGFLRACQGRDEEALRLIETVVHEDGAAPATRTAAQSLFGMLREHSRLRPALERATTTGDVDELQRALQAAPTTLSVAHADSVDRLRALADGCRALDPAPDAGAPVANRRVLQSLEAFILCNLEGGMDALARLCAKPDAAPDAANAHRHHRFAHALKAIRDRGRHDPDDLSGPAAEAWLRYWHGRLLSDEPEKRPGQFKLAANAIRGLPLTPPEGVAGTLGIALRDELPGLPAGLIRGLYLYIAINMVHGFGDGNGRLSRFLLAWECEIAGVAPLLIPVTLRARTARALDAAWLDADLGPLIAVVDAARTERDRMLGELHESGPRPPL